MTTTFAERPDVTPRGDYTFPSAAQWTLPNGVRVVHMPTSGKLLSLMLSSRGGAAAEGRHAEGVATLVNRMRREGTRTHPGVTFAEALDQIGADYAARASLASDTVEMTVPASTLARAVALLAETARELTLSADEIAQQRRLQLEELRQTFAQPAQRANLALDEVCFSPLDRRSRPILGTLDSIPVLSDEVVRQFAHRHLIPAQTTLIVAGSCSRAELDAALDDSLASWSGSPEAATIGWAQSAVVPGSSQVLLVDRPGAVQTEVRLGALSVGRRDERWASLVIGAHVLGGSINSRLSAVLREEKGYTYGIQAYASAVSSGAGQFVVETSVDTDSTGPALQDMLSVLSETLEDGITDEECRGAVGEVLGRDGMRFQTAGAFARVLHDYVEHDLPLDWLNTRRRAVAEVTADSASRSLAATVSLDRPQLVLVGDAARIGAAVERALDGDPVTVV